MVMAVMMVVVIPVVMIVGMIMVMGMSCMTVGFVVIVVMTVAMGPPVAIGATFGREGRNNRCHVRTKQRQHIGHHLILTDSQHVIFDLTGRVPVPDMPRQTRQVIPPNFQQGFRLGANANETAIGQFECIAVIKGLGLREIHKDFGSAIGNQQFAAQEAGRVIKGQAVFDLTGPIACPCDMVHSDRGAHAAPPIKWLRRRRRPGKRSVRSRRA
jgi:tellurite resistance-related uncharacterized protein